MTRGPFIVCWRLETSSLENVHLLEKDANTFARSELPYIDTLVTRQNGVEINQERESRLSDYFERLCILPKSSGMTPAIRLFFHCKPNVGRFWKDVMASVLKQAAQTDIPLHIVLDYRVDDEQLYYVASQLPNWFSRLGEGSRTFWKTSAEYLLDHSQFTFSELEAFAEIPADSLRAMHRNSHRAIKKEESPDPLWSKWDYGLGRNVYRMDAPIRDEILCLTQRDVTSVASL